MDLLHIVEQAHSPERILEPATRVVAERMRVDACVVLLLDEHRNLVRGVADGSQRTDGTAPSIAARVIAERRVAATHGDRRRSFASLVAPGDRVADANVLQRTVRRANPESKGRKQRPRKQVPAGPRVLGAP